MAVPVLDQQVAGAFCAAESGDQNRVVGRNGVFALDLAGTPVENPQRLVFDDEHLAMAIAVDVVDLSRHVVRGGGMPGVGRSPLPENVAAQIDRRDAGDLLPVVLKNHGIRFAVAVQVAVAHDNAAEIGQIDLANAFRAPDRCCFLQSRRTRQGDRLRRVATFLPGQQEDVHVGPPLRLDQRQRDRPGTQLHLARLRPASPVLADYATPPASAQPQVYWQWINGNVTREGITADLEAMHRVGINGVLVQTVGGGPPGPMRQMNPQFFDMMEYAAREAERLGMTISMSVTSGWAGCGGPWVKPEQSMQMITFSEAAANRSAAS
jgi:hypothetical protein